MPLLLLTFLAAAVPALAQKKDVIVLSNGDRVTGEIKSYDQGRLTVDTSHSSWIKIKWSLIESIASDKQFDVETIDGVHHFGVLAPSDLPGKLLIVSGPQTIEVGFFDVFTLAPVHQTFWRRWDGSLDVGFNYTQSSNLIQFSLNGAGTFRQKEDQIVAELSSFFSRQDEVTGAERGSFSLRYDRFLKNRWILEAGGGLDRNIDLGLKLRVSAGAGAGRYLVQTNQTQMTVFAGLLGNHETPVAGESKYNGEATVGWRYEHFMYDFPKLTVTGSVQVFPSLSEHGRVRLEAAAAVKRELVSDLYLALSIFDSYDSRDPTTLEPRNDWGPTVSVGWQF